MAPGTACDAFVFIYLCETVINNKIIKVYNIIKYVWRGLLELYVASQYIDVLHCEIIFDNISENSFLVGTSDFHTQF